MNCSSLISGDLSRGPFSATKLWNEVVHQMKISVPVKKRRWRMKTYQDVFLASEALDWLHGYLKQNPNFGVDVTRQQAIQLCEKFMKNGIIVDARGKRYNAAFEDNNHLYRFVKNLRYSPYKITCEKMNLFVGKENIQLEEVNAASKSWTANGQSNFIFTDDTSSKELHDRPLQTSTATPHVERRRSLRLRSTPFIAVPSRTPLVNKLNILSSSKNESHSLLKTREKGKYSHRNVNRFNEVIVNPAAFVAQNQRSLSNEEIRQVWWNIGTTRLKRLMDLDDVLANSLRVEGYDDGCIWENAKNKKFPKAIDVLPQWLIAAMKCLINWPDREECLKNGFPGYAGFERDVFKAILDFFSQNEECPLIPRHLLVIFRKTVDLLFTCKVSGMRSLQYCCLLIPPNKRGLLQVLLKFMVRLAENHIIFLSDDLPIKEMLIQSFSFTIFGVAADMDVIRLMYFMIDKFPEYFLNPQGLQFQVEQRLLFLKNCRQNKFTACVGSAASFCERVTPQEYKEQSMITSQRSLKDLLSSIVGDESMDEKERKRQLKQFEKSYPDIYHEMFPGDEL